MFDEQDIREFEATADEGLRLLKLGMRAIRDAHGEEEAKEMVLEKLKSDAIELRTIVKSVRMAQLAISQLAREREEFTIDDEDDFRRDVLDDLDDLPTTED